MTTVHAIHYSNDVGWWRRVAPVHVLVSDPATTLHSASDHAAVHRASILATDGTTITVSAAVEHIGTPAVRNLYGDTHADRS